MCVTTGIRLKQNSYRTYQWQTIHLAKCLNYTCRYKDDVLSLHNPNFNQCLYLIFLSVLEIQNTSESERSTLYLNLFLVIVRDNRLQTRIYDKHNTINFRLSTPYFSSVTNPLLHHNVFTYISSYIMLVHVYIIRNFINRYELFTHNLFQELNRINDWNQLYMVYGHNQELFDQSDAMVPQLINNIYSWFWSLDSSIIVCSVNSMSVSFSRLCHSYMCE